MRFCRFRYPASRSPVFRTFSTSPTDYATLAQLKSGYNTLKLKVLECIRTHLTKDQASNPHSLKSADVIVQGYSQPLLDGFTCFLLDVRSALGGSGPGPRTPPVHIQKWSVLSSPFAHKTAFTQFERRTHRREVEIFGMGPEITKRFIWYLQQHAPPDIKIECHVHEYIPLTEFLPQPVDPVHGKQMQPQAREPNF